MSESFGPDCINSTAAHGIEHCLLGMSGFRPDSHVAQQSRRDRLRFQQVQVPPATTNLLDLPHDGRNCGAFYDQSMYSSGLMLDFSSGANAGGAISSLSQNPIICSNISAAAAAVAAEVGHEQQNSSLWKGLGSQPHSSVWATNYGGFQDLSTQVSNPSGALLSHDSQRQYGEQPCVSLPFYSNALHGVAASSPSAVAAPEIEMASLVQQVPQPNPWMEGVNELALLPSFNPSRIGNAAVWMTRDTQQWGHTNETLGRSNSVNGEFAATQGLSLSLSSNPPPELPVVPFEAKFGPVGFPSTATGFSRTLQSPKPNDAVSICSYSGYSSGSRNPGNSVQCNGRSSAEEHRGVGPLGPFTGYATILKSSKYLKPAQLLLDESCSAATGREPSKPFESPQTLASAVPVATYCAVFTGDNDVHRRSGNSGASSSSLHSSNGGSGEAGGVSEGGDQLHHPQIQQKKAKLLFMQGEVCRRYKQYNQQMQMAISSFESVAGLSSAIPFLSLALKTVSKHFRFLKSLISEQLLNISRALGEEFISSAGSGRTDSATAPRLKFLDQTLRKQKEEENGLGFFENNQPIWRPQRGLPEKSVAVLRAWLFDHFLHPYPTDTDKLMLANQTGLSRNQVSNWFINARVRVWKPMVEEIHMLETKGLSEVDLNSSKYDGTTSAVNSQPVENQQEHQSSMPSDCSSVGLASNVEDCRNMGQWHPEKRSRMEHYAIADSLEGGLAGLAPYQNGFDMGGLGGVSLTLGLRQEDTHYQQQQQQMRPYFGSHMVHDFVG